VVFLYHPTHPPPDPLGSLLPIELGSGLMLAFCVPPNVSVHIPRPRSVAEEEDHGE
jgi:hypothetical protein